MIDQDEIRRARQTNLVQYLMSKGYSLRREPGKGENFRLVGYQGLIVQKNHFFRFGGRNEKGNAIDFLVQIEGMTFLQAVEELLGCDVQEIKSVQDKQRKDFALPAAAADNKRIIKYLKHRGIPEQIIKELIKRHMVYQDQRGNCVFPCMDSKGRVRGGLSSGVQLNKDGSE